MKPRVGVLAAVVVLLAACGGSKETAPMTKTQYEARAGAVLRTYIASVSTSSDPGDVGRGAEDTADALARISPPGEIAAVHGRLVDGFRGLAKDEQELADTIFSSDDDFQAAMDRFANSEGGVEAQLALRELKRRGYRLPSLLGVRNVGPFPGMTVP